MTFGNRGRRAADLGIVAAVAVTSILLALRLTPMQSVSAGGQTILVGTSAPAWSLSGPGELDLFGQHVPTAIHFTGPVRPRVKLSRITLSRELADFVDAGGTSADQLESALVRGWWHYFAWQALIVALSALVLLAGVAGWRRRGARWTVTFVAVGGAVVEAINLGTVMVTAYTAPGRLRHVTSLQTLVGDAPGPAMTPRAEPRSSTPSNDLVVVGDSTAAGLGNPPVANASTDDRACGRSRDSFSADLAAVTSWRVTNPSCSGATIDAGLLGPETIRGRTLPAQLDAPVVDSASIIIVSIGANDVHWSDLLRACVAVHDCQNAAGQAYFQQQLSVFSRAHLNLLTQLLTLPAHPLIVVNLYYNPFAGGGSCLTGAGVTATKQTSMVSQLTALNTLLADGAKTASIPTGSPHFSGHGPCAADPYVQSPHTDAPLHPTAAGELAIALADLDVINAAAGVR